MTHKSELQYYRYNTKSIGHLVLQSPRPYPESAGFLKGKGVVSVVSLDNLPSDVKDSMIKAKFRMVNLFEIKSERGRARAFLRELARARLGPRRGKVLVHCWLGRGGSAVYGEYAAFVLGIPAEKYRYISPRAKVNEAFLKRAYAEELRRAAAEILHAGGKTHFVRIPKSAGHRAFKGRKGAKLHKK